MRHPYVVIVAGLLGLFLASFAVVEALEVPLLTDPGPWLDAPGLLAAMLGVGLLVADVALPVPSSGVMVAHGALFGVAVGAALSLTGGVGATLVAFVVGRRGQRLVDRIVATDQQQRAERLLARYGLLAIVVTRPVPMLAETTAIVAGTSRLRLGPALLAGAVGNLVPAAAYAVTGAVAASFVNQTAVFLLVVAVAVLFWFAARRAEDRLMIAAAGDRASGA
ncbi:MAG: VTT domain-containing protein [Actinobacteria bacterium]|nr:VTT domain-containing protein [Actinomycetota bacterium]